MTLQLGIADFFAAAVLLGVAVAALARESWGRHREKKYMECAVEEAVELDVLIDEIREWDRKVNHYRHNIHCPVCGRFSRQAEGWPGGVSDCKLHGIEVHVGPPTASVTVILTVATVDVELPAADVFYEIAEPVHAPEPEALETGVIVIPVLELERTS